MSSRAVVSLGVLAFAILFRVNHYDVAWFGYDQVKFMFQARQVLAGHWNVLGPDASGLNIIGPLYSYLLAGLLWIRNDPFFLVLFGVICDAIGAWFIYDTARRVTNGTAGVIAAASYLTAPMLMLGSRLLWNPTLLPPLVAVGWWLVVLHSEKPSTAKLLALALVAGLTLPLHATGVFHAFGFAVAVLVSTRPTMGQLIAALVVAAVPLTPVLPRLLGEGGDVGGLGARIALPADLISDLRGLADTTLSFPRAFGSDWTARASEIALHLQALVAAIGVAISIAYRGPYRGFWLGLAGSVAAELMAAAFYGAAISWHYFVALIPAACFWIAKATTAVPRFHTAVGAVTIGIAVTHLLFLTVLDRDASRSGLIYVSGHLGFRAPPAEGYGPTLRDLGRVADAAEAVVPDGSTAMRVVHGGRGELWRESGAELMPPATAPQESWTREFIVMGPGATAVLPGAQVIGERVCAFERPAIVWRGQHGRPQDGWDLRDLRDQEWMVFQPPMRMTGASLNGPAIALAAWRSPQLIVRGHFTAAADRERRAFGLTVRSPGYVQHLLTHASLNGSPLLTNRNRVLSSSVTRTEEWYLDATQHIDIGENVLALAVDGPSSLFDFDVFEVACRDDEWYQ